MKTHANNPIFTRFTAAIEALGYRVTDIGWEYGDTAAANVRLGARRVARLAFTAYDDKVRFLVHPVDSQSYRILAGASTIHLDGRLDSEIDEIESFFRSHLVLRGKLDYAEFPTNRALSEWLDRVAKVKLPAEHEANAMVASSPAGVRLVEMARLASAAPFDRARVLRLHVAAAEANVPVNSSGRWLCHGLGFINNTAKVISDDRYGRQALAWKVGTHGAYLYNDRLTPPSRGEEMAFEAQLDVDTPAMPLAPAA